MALYSCLHGEEAQTCLRLLWFWRQACRPIQVSYNDIDLSIDAACILSATPTASVNIHIIWPQVPFSASNKDTTQVALLGEIAEPKRIADLHMGWTELCTVSSYVQLMIMRLPVTDTLPSASGPPYAARWFASSNSACLVAVVAADPACVQ